jgi:hypothetical protein
VLTLKIPRLKAAEFWMEPGAIWKANLIKGAVFTAASG